MDRSKWEYKKLGDICKSINAGGTPSRGNSAYWNGDIPWVKIKDMNSKYVNSTEEFITNEGLNNSSAKLFEPGTILYSIFATIGAASILKIPATTNQAIAGIVLGDGCDRDFYYYYLTSLKTHFENISKGVAQNNINLSVLRNQKVVVPPIEDQQRIVAELDCLNEMIAVKQEQLKEFDKLAQSIFYDMFGDPIENEKGFERHSLGEIAEFKNGLNFKPVEEGNEIRILGVSDFQDLKEIKTTDSLSMKCIMETVDEDYCLKTGDIVIVRSNGSKKLVGRNVLISFEEKDVAYSGFCIRCRLTSKECLPLYLNCVLSAPAIKELMTSGGRGCNIANINQQVLNRLMVSIPPLALQQQFADKISAIEAQKELVKQSIAETQTLLSYTMDKYFG